VDQTLVGEADIVPEEVLEAVVVVAAAAAVPALATYAS
jgi:hypothetical protein